MTSAPTAPVPTPPPLLTHVRSGGPIAVAPGAGLSEPGLWLTATDHLPRDQPGRSALRASCSLRVASAVLNCPRECLALVHDAAGKPRLVAHDGSDIALPGDLSRGAPLPALSHATRAGLVLTGLAPGRIGVDLETVGDAPGPTDLLHPAERAALATTRDRTAEFALIWALKEAYGKWLGVGLRHDPSWSCMTRDVSGAWQINDPHTDRRPAGLTAQLVTTGSTTDPIRHAIAAVWSA